MYYFFVLDFHSPLSAVQKRLNEAEVSPAVVSAIHQWVRISVSCPITVESTFINVYFIFLNSH